MTHTIKYECKMKTQMYRGFVFAPYIDQRDRCVYFSIDDYNDEIACNFKSLNNVKRYIDDIYTNNNQHLYELCDGHL